MSVVDAFWEPRSSADDLEGVALPPPVTEDGLRRWEDAHSVKLPPALARALAIQNGGVVRETELTLERLEGFSPLSEPKWEHVFEDRGLAPGDRGLQFLIGE